MTDASGPEVASLTVADHPDSWRAGFAVDDDGTVRIGGVRVVLVGADAGRGVTGWSLRGLAPGSPADLDGLATVATDEPACTPAAHPNGAIRIDHVVLLTDDLDRTVAAATALGLDLRRVRDHTGPGGAPVCQAFFVAGEVIVEVVAPAEEPDEPRPRATPFGLAVAVADLAAARALLGDAVSEERPAVQPGRRVATVRHRPLGLSGPLLLMSPHPGGGPAPA